MEFTTCPWDSLTHFPSQLCESNLCAWVVQPANTWSNISYLIAAIVIYRQKDWLKTERLWFSFVVFLLFIGSTLFHMSSTVIGRDLDVGAMLMLSSFSLTLTLARSYKIKPVHAITSGLAICLLSLPSLHMEMGSQLFLIQYILTAILEFMYSRRHPPPAHIKKNLIVAVSLFFFALFLNILDMNRVWCLPENNVITLHAIWHLICGYCIYLLVKYYCFKDSATANA